MRVGSMWLLLTVLCLGCNDPDEARREAARNNLKRIGLAFQNYHAAQQDAIVAELHEIAVDSEYYTTGPQQGRPADGTFAAGTEVSIVDAAGSYILVRSGDGVEGYVASDAVKSLNGDEPKVHDAEH